MINLQKAEQSKATEDIEKYLKECQRLSQRINFIKNGQYEKKADKGNARLYPSFSIDIGYYLKKAHTHSPKIFMRYQSWAEYPYSPDFIPVMTHINLNLGAKFFINTKTKKND